MLRHKKDPPAAGPPDVEPAPDARAPDSFDLSLSDFLLEHMDPRAGYKCRLFRIYNRPGQRDKCAFLQTWEDAIPEYEEIANEYGPGPYRLNVIYSPPGGKRTATSRTINIDASWGGKSAATVPGQPAAQMYGAQQAQQQQMQMFQMFLTTLVQVFQASGKGNGNGGAGAGLAAIVEMQKAMAQMTMDNYASQNKLIERVTRDRLDIGAEEPEPDSASFVMQAVQWLMAAWKQYGPQIMQSPKMAGKFLSPKARGLEQIEYALSHPDEYETLYTQFIERSGAKPEAIDDFIHALGYPTPHELKEESARNTAGAGAQ